MGGFTLGKWHNQPLLLYKADFGAFPRRFHFQLGGFAPWDKAGWVSSVSTLFCKCKKREKREQSRKRVAGTMSEAENAAFAPPSDGVVLGDFIHIVDGVEIVDEEDA